MPHLSIKDVPEPWVEALRLRAAGNHRSLQGELMAIVEQTVLGTAEPALAPKAGRARSDQEPGRARIVGFDPRGWPIVQQGWKTPEQVVAELRQQHPRPVKGQPLARDIIRQERDSR